jgi:hypothetical protein
MAFYRKTIRGTASGLERQLNQLAKAGKLHEVWNLGVTDNPEDIELNLELIKNGTPTAGNLIYIVVSGYTTKIDQLENELREQKKYISTAHRKPLHNDKEKGVAVILKSK